MITLKRGGNMWLISGVHTGLSSASRTLLLLQTWDGDLSMASSDEISRPHFLPCTSLLQLLPWTCRRHTCSSHDWYLHHVASASWLSSA